MDIITLPVVIPVVKLVEVLVLVLHTHHVNVDLVVIECVLPVLCLHVAEVKKFLVVQQQQIEHVLDVALVSIKIPILIRILLVKLALPRVLAAPNLLLVLKQQIERVQVAYRGNIKIPMDMPVLLVKVALLLVVLVKDL